MKCLKCGFETGSDFGFCPQCGQPLTAPVPENPEMPTVIENPAAKRVLGFIKDKLFLIVATLISIATLLSFSGGGVPLLNILLTVFIWLLYSKGAKNKVESAQIKNISGMVYASYIITNVLVGILAVCGLIFAGAMALIQHNSEAIDEFKTAFTDASGLSQQIAENILSIPGIWIIIIFAVVCAVILIFNIAGLRNIHKFIKSVYMSVDMGQGNYHKPNTARAWLLAFGILEVVSGVASKDVKSIISGGCFGAAMIITSILIEKHFVSMQEQPQLQEPTVNE